MPTPPSPTPGHALPISMDIRELPIHLGVASVLRHCDRLTQSLIEESNRCAVEEAGMRFFGLQLVTTALPPAEADRSPPIASTVEPKREDIPLAAAYVLEHPGKLACLIGPWQAEAAAHPAFEKQVLALLQRLVERAASWGVELLQTIHDEDTPYSQDLLRKAGFKRLTQLDQMVLKLDSVLAGQSVRRSEAAKPHAHRAKAELEWRPYRVTDQPAWLRWLDETYVETDDCPELNGLRTTQASFDGYLAAAAHGNDGNGPHYWGGWLGPARPVTRVAEEKAVGEAGASPDLPKIVTGYLLHLIGTDEWELAYMGVAVAHRRQGYGRETLHHAIQTARQLGAKRLWLAVDRRNQSAIQLYRAHGFVAERHLEAWFLALSRPSV